MFRLTTRYIWGSNRVAGADKDDTRMETEMTAENMMAPPNPEEVHFVSYAVSPV